MVNVQLIHCLENQRVEPSEIRSIQFQLLSKIGGGGRRERTDRYFGEICRCGLIERLLLPASGLDDRCVGDHLRFIIGSSHFRRVRTLLLNVVGCRGWRGVKLLFGDSTGGDARWSDPRVGLRSTDTSRGNERIRSAFRWRLRRRGRSQASDV